MEIIVRIIGIILIISSIISVGIIAGLIDEDNDPTCIGGILVIVCFTIGLILVIS